MWKALPRVPLCGGNPTQTAPRLWVRRLRSDAGGRCAVPRSSEQALGGVRSELGRERCSGTNAPQMVRGGEVKLAFTHG